KTSGSLHLVGAKTRCRVVWSAEERQPDMAFWVVPVGAHEYDGLRGPQLKLTVDYGQRGVWWDQSREHVGAAAVRTAVAALPAVVGGKKVAEGRQQIIVAARAGLDDGQAGRRVGGEDVQQSVSPVSDLSEGGG